jgi:hypothetical protein
MDDTQNDALLQTPAPLQSASVVQRWGAQYGGPWQVSGSVPLGQFVGGGDTTSACAAAGARKAAASAAKGKSRRLIDAAAYQSRTGWSDNAPMPRTPRPRRLDLA